MNLKSSQKDPQSYAVIGSAIEVHRELRRGFSEAVYREALSLELASRGIPFEREVSLQVRYKTAILSSCYRADFICFGQLLVECKALNVLSGVEASQVLNYLRASGLERALVLNFGAPAIQVRRFIFTADGVRHCGLEAES